MNRLSIRSNCRTAAALLVLALLARAPFAHGLLLHDHGDDGVHSHAVTADDMREVDLHATWHRHHDDTSNDSDSAEYADSLFIFLNAPATAMSIHGSSGTVIASIRHLSSSVLPRSIPPGDPTDVAHLPSANPRRPACALDALLQTSRALLL